MQNWWNASERYVLQQSSVLPLRWYVVSFATISLDQIDQRCNKNVAAGAQRSNELGPKNSGSIQIVRTNVENSLLWENAETETHPTGVIHKAMVIAGTFKTCF